MRKPNRLATEASPYLLQHAHNPVAWWPWCAEALEEAKQRDVPLLLSIGYSACHWCHVMERESFENDAIAEVMNAHFVCIKVDREERPDLDQIYQLTVQLMGKNGGWPLTVFLTPAQKPFFAGTYFPPEDRYGMAGFPKILAALADAYRTRRDEVDGQANELTEAIAKVGRAESDGPGYEAGPGLLSQVTQSLLKRMDKEWGGFGKQPKFPNTMPLELMMRAGQSAPARLQLDKMRAGGIWDHLGGGFHRYSTDQEWLVPHFEKMLYDNALLLRSYVDAYREYGDARYADTAREIAAYVAREMTDPEGGFYASQDADSSDAAGEKQEGAFFVWSPADTKSVLGDDAPKADALFGITPAGNFEEHGRPTFKTVLATEEPVPADIRARMFAAREKRPKPFRDEKVLTSWSSLMIGALAEAGMTLSAPEMVDAAKRAFAFLSDKLATDGRVARLCKKVDGEWRVKSPGFLDDHAYFTNAALDLYEATGSADYVQIARAVADQTLASFWLEDDGFYFTPKDGESLITRSKDPFDQAIPSGVSMACRALLRLGAMVGGGYALIAETELMRLATEAVRNPFAYGQTLCELDRLVRGAVDIVIVGEGPNADVLVKAAYAKWLPNRTIAYGTGGAPALTKDKPAHAHPVAYVCRGRTCSLPVSTAEELLKLLA